MSALSHHWRMLTQAIHDDRARPRSGVGETAFLPAALEVIERPVSPTARATSRVLLIGLVLTILWAVLGRVDVVATAPGKLMPSGSVKLIQSPGSGVVRAIHIHDGDTVRKGQPLLDLDPTLSGADLAQASKALAVAELEIARNRAIADALSGRGLHFVAPAGTAPEIADSQRRLIAAQIAEVEAAARGLGAARDSALADAAGAGAQVAKLTATVPILDQQIASMNALDARGYAPGLRLLELQRQRRQESGDLSVAVAQRTRAYAEARKSAEQAQETREQARRQALADLVKAEGEAVLRREEVTKATQRRRFQRITAPVDGTIQQLSVHTIGGVVEPARSLMILVPSRGGIEVEARVLNKDIGFVSVGQTAAVKLEAFPFTRYGTVAGHIRSISRDAVPDPKLGSVYVAMVSLDHATITVDGRAVPLTAGLSATVDVRTGSRPIISYLLSPLRTSVSQAAREK